MKITKLFAALFALAGLALGCFTGWLGFTYRNAEPVLLEQPEAASQTAQKLLDSVCAGDYTAAQALLYGTPELGVDRDAADHVGQVLWDAFVGSLSYEFMDEYYATDSGLARDIRITGLDMSSVTASLRERAQALLKERVENATDVSQIYDENNEYREDFAMEVLCDAMEQAMAEDARYISWDVTLNLVYRDGQWWIMPDDALLEAISGGIVG